jgi:hypothetical protein
MRVLFQSRKSARLFSLILWVALLGFGYINWFREDGGQRTHRSATIDCESGRDASPEIELNPNSSKRLLDQRLTVATLGPGDGCYLNGQELRTWVVRRSTGSGQVYFRRELGRVKVQQVVRSTYARLGHGQRQFVDKKFGPMAKLQTYDLLTLKVLELREPSASVMRSREPHPYVKLEEAQTWVEIQKELSLFKDDSIIVSMESLQDLEERGVLQPEELQRFLAADRRAELILDPAELVPENSRSRDERMAQSALSRVLPRRLVVVSQISREVEAYNLNSLIGDLHPELTIIWKRERGEAAAAH